MEKPTSASMVPGDVNGDGVLEDLDIAAFGLALLGPTAYTAAYPGLDPDIVLDMNNDGSFIDLDIAGFVATIGI